jgi:hypothetical protein
MAAAENAPPPPKTEKRLKSLEAFCSYLHRGAKEICTRDFIFNFPPLSGADIFSGYGHTPESATQHRHGSWG